LRQNSDIGRQNTSADQFCPYIEKPLPECHCVEMDGRKTTLAMRFCLKDFKSCRIYRRIYLLEAHLKPRPPQVISVEILGLLLGFSGMALVFLGKKGVPTEVAIGDFLVLITSFLWACNTVYTKRIISEFAPFQIVLYPMAFSVPFFFLAGYIWDVKMITHLDLKVLSALIYQGLVTASFGFVAWSSMLQKYGAVSLHSFVFIMPIAGVVLGGLVLGEAITWDIILALGFIASGIVVVNLKTRECTPLYPPRGV